MANKIFFKILQNACQLKLMSEKFADDYDFRGKWSIDSLTHAQNMGDVPLDFWTGQ